MFKRCTNSDIERISEYIGADYASCLYLYMDLLKYGPNSDYTKTWILEEDAQITCIALSYHTALHIYSHDSFNIQEVIDLAIELKPSQICALKSIILAMEKPLALIGYGAELGYVGRLKSFEHRKSDFVQRATVEDVDQISQLLYNDEGIGASYSLEDLKKQFRERLTHGFVRSYIIKDNGQIVAHLGTGAEVGNVSIITYVITDNRYRGRGYAKSLYQVACSDLELEGKEVYAVYYTDNAIHLHHSVGFKDFCECGKLFLKTH